MAASYWGKQCARDCPDDPVPDNLGEFVAWITKKYEGLHESRRADATISLDVEDEGYGAFSASLSIETVEPVAAPKEDI